MNQRGSSSRWPVILGGAALTRASTRLEINLATSSDDQYFYVWRQD